jgi:putative DNA primase/helicase
LNALLTQEQLDSLLDAMRSHGIVYNTKENGPILADGKLHRFQVDGDRNDRRNGWYCVHVDERPAGAFGCYKRWGDQRFAWTAKGTAPLTREQREEIAQRQREQREANAAAEAERQAHAATRSQAMWDAAAECTEHPYLTRKGVGAYGVRIGDFWKERREDGKPFLAAKGALLIRMRDGTGTTGLQAIYAQPLKMGDEARDKDFVYGAKKAGAWATIGKPMELNGCVTLLVVEGYATGASVHEATGLGVIVAFDAGNLMAVGREVRRLMPKVRLVFAADNDQWTDRPVRNPGVTKARDAAAAVGGEVIAPAFANVELKPTDWNDMHAQSGLTEVRRQLMAALDPQPEPAPEPDSEPDEPPPIENLDDFGPIDRDEPAALLPADLPEPEEEEIDNPYFTVRGHDRTQIFIYQHEKKMITARGEADWSESALTAIAPLHWWELNFPGDKGLNRKLAVNWLQRMAFKRGYFDPNSLRGRGAWRDDGRFVFHFGHQLWVDGQMMDVTKIDSTYIYEQGRRLRLPAEEPLSTADGKKVFETFQGFAWTRPASAILMAGWCALAPVGGALRWRPHVWITGGAGSGKTTILNFTHWLLNGSNLYAQGNSTEAGIRQSLRTDSLGVIFDESEQNNEREALRMQNVLSLIRQSSTESDAKTFKGTQGGDSMHFIIRSMFCMGSIQVGLKQQADMERISILALKPKREAVGEEEKAAAAWKRISASMTALRSDAELPAKMLRRTLTLLPIIVQNVEVFAQAAAETFGSQRDGDQYGALLAGAWSLVSTKLATIDEARAMIARYDWSEYLEGSDTEESDKALAALMGRLVRVKSQEVSLYELTQRAAGVDCEMKDISTKEADNVLRRHGLMIEWNGARHVENGTLLVAYKHGELDRLMEATPYAADLKGQLLRIAGAGRTAGSVRFLGTPSRAVKLPLTLVLSGAGDELPVPDDEDFDRISF